MNAKKVLGSLVATLALAGALVAAPASAQQTTTKTLFLVFPGRGGTVNGGSVGNVRISGGNGAGYTVGISGASANCNVKVGSLEEALKLQERIGAPNTTRIQCGDTAATRAPYMNLAYPLAASQSFEMDWVP